MDFGAPVSVWTTKTHEFVVKKIIKFVYSNSVVLVFMVRLEKVDKSYMYKLKLW